MGLQMTQIAAVIASALAAGGGEPGVPTTYTMSATEFLATAAASYRTTDATKYYFQACVATNPTASVFVFQCKGSSATLDIRNNNNATGAITVSVDGAAYVTPSQTGTVYTLFSGLADAWHTVTIRTGSAFGSDNIYLLKNQTVALSVTGVGAAVRTPQYWLHPGDAVSTIATSPALTANAANYLPLYRMQTPSAGVSNIGTIRLRAAASRMFVHATATHVFYSKNGGTPVKVALPAPGNGGSGVVIEGLGGDEATYNVWMGSEGRWLAVGADSPLIDIGAKKYLDQYGDSITDGDTVDATNGTVPGDVDALGAAAALGYLGTTYGLSGVTTSALKAVIDAILAAQPAKSSSDVAVLAIGRNDAASGAFDATRTADYTYIVDALLAKGYGRVICRGILPAPNNSSTWPGANGSIQSIVTAKADPRVVFVDTSSWIGYATIDGTHPTGAGYADIRARAIAAYTPLLP